MSQAIFDRIMRRVEIMGFSESSAPKMVGLSDSTLRNIRRRIERGEEDPGISSSTLTALAPILNTTPEWLFSGTGPEDPSIEGRDWLTDFVMSCTPDQRARAEKIIQAAFDFSEVDPPEPLYSADEIKAVVEDFWEEDAAELAADDPAERVSGWILGKLIDYRNSIDQSKSKTETESDQKATNLSDWPNL